MFKVKLIVIFATSLTLIGAACDKPNTPTNTITVTPTPLPTKSDKKPPTPTSTPRPTTNPTTIPMPTAPKSSCDPNYSGCVPVASDVDCAGGSGNGPAYVKGPIKVIGSDIYGLDRDGDGIACEK